MSATPPSAHGDAAAPVLASAAEPPADAESDPPVVDEPDEPLVELLGLGVFVWTGAA